MTAAATPPVQRRRPLRALCRVLLLLLLGYGVAVLAGLPPALPFDLALNLAAFDVDDALRAPADGKRRLIVLQHGLWRSSWSLWRLERALVAHGYLVLNSGYPSTQAKVEDHAARLQAALSKELAAVGPVDSITFVGHSLGGLVVAEYLRRADACRPAQCIYIGSPLHGAVLCELRKRWWLFALLMGDQAALQLSPDSAVAQRPVPMPCPCGTIVGDLGDGNAAIPGRDDGTVAVVEAHLAGEADSVTLPLGHTALSCDAATIRQVLHFLRHGRFAPPASDGH